MANHDELMDPLEETRFQKRYSDVTLRLSKTLHFTHSELQSLLLIFHKLTKDGPMERKRFRDMLHNTLDMTSDTLMDRIFMVLDQGSPLAITMETWVTAMSLFMRGTQEEQIKYCFSVYDMLGDGLIGKDSMFNLMRKSLIKQPQDEDVDEAVKDFVDVILKKMDLDRDGKISFNDFRTSALRSPLLMESLGECVPSRSSTLAFLTTFAPIYNKR